MLEELKDTLKELNELIVKHIDVHKEDIEIFKQVLKERIWVDVLRKMIEDVKNTTDDERERNLIRLFLYCSTPSVMPSHPAVSSADEKQPSLRVASKVSKPSRNPKTPERLKPAKIKSVAASALAQAPDKKKSPSK